MRLSLFLLVSSRLSAQPSLQFAPPPNRNSTPGNLKAYVRTPTTGDPAKDSAADFKSIVSSKYTIRSTASPIITNLFNGWRLTVTTSEVSFPATGSPPCPAATATATAPNSMPSGIASGPPTNQPPPTGPSTPKPSPSASPRAATLSSSTTPSPSHPAFRTLNRTKLTPQDLANRIDRNRLPLPANSLNGVWSTSNSTAVETYNANQLFAHNTFRSQVKAYSDRLANLQSSNEIDAGNFQFTPHSLTLALPNRIRSMRQSSSPSWANAPSAS